MFILNLKKKQYEVARRLLFEDAIRITEEALRIVNGSGIIVTSKRPKTFYFKN